MIATPWYRHYSKYRSYFSNSLSSMKNKDEIKAYLEILLSLATIIIFSIFALRPTLITIAKLYKDIDYKSEVITKMDSKIENLKIAQDYLNRSSQSLTKLSEAVPDGPQPESTYRQFEGINSNNLPITYLNINKADLLKTPTSMEGSIGISLSFNGNFPEIIYFVESIEKLRRQISLSSLVISTQNTKIEDDAKILNATIYASSNFLD